MNTNSFSCARWPTPERLPEALRITDECSPYSGTTVLSSMACGADLMDHVLTQLPLAMLAAGISIVLYVLIAFISFL